MASGRHDQPGRSTAADDFFEVEQRFYAAMQASDADALEAMMSDECVYIHSFGSQDSKASYLKKLRDGHFTYRGIEFTQQHVLRRGPVTVVVGTMTGIVSVQGMVRKLNNVRTSVWERVAGDWKLLAFQPTPWLDR